MSMEAAVEKSAILDAIVAHVTEGAASAKAQRLEVFTRHYLRRVPEDELESRTLDTWSGLIRSHFEMVRARKRDETLVRVFNPTEDSHGWESSHTVIEILTPDLPFLVDSTTMAISELNISIHLIIHPVYRIVRDQGGYLMDLAPLQQELEGSRAESVMHFEVDRQTEPKILAELETRIQAYLADVAKSVRDWRAMHLKAVEACEYLEAAETPYSQEGVDETVEFLRWLADDHFTFLGYREYAIEERDGKQYLGIVPGTGLGILAEDARVDEQRAATELSETAPRAIAESGPMIITKTNSKATVHRSGYMDYIGIMRFDEQGQLIGEQRFLGLYTSSAYNRRPWNIPYVRRKVQAVMQASGFAPETHGGKALLHIMETLPRDELFQASPNELYELVIGIFDLQERQKTRLFIRADRFKRFFSCLVYIPRERFNTDIRERIQGILKRSLSGERVDFTVQVSESMLARLHVIVHVKPGLDVDYDVEEIEMRLVEAVRSWYDRLKDILVEKHGEEQGLRWARRFGANFPAAYLDDVTPWVAAFDVENLANLNSADDLRTSLYRPRKRKKGFFRFKTFRCNTTIPLSDVLPMLENMGLRVVSERPYRLQLDDKSVRWIQDFDVQLSWGGDIDLDLIKDHFMDAFGHVVRGEMESDGFNELVLAANLGWRQVTVIRTYCKYLLQTGVPFSQAYMEQTLADHPGIARLLVELFEAQLDPARERENKTAQESRARALRSALQRFYGRGDDLSLDERLSRLVDVQKEGREAQIEACRDALRFLIEGVRSLDEDRILRGFIGCIAATLRTNAFQERAEDGFYPFTSLKLDSTHVPDLPKPRPWREIFVYSPRMEGIHLRGGPVARGGLRWSDRREDFRTEVLGLMKAQMVKNTMIVPVGAKGGFVVKHLPESQDREEIMAEVVACYRFFIHGLLSITDNLREDQLVHPEGVVRRDEDDPYLVVAADKGTATFSDIANSVSESHDFWLGDGFASGGSAGYDHKKMGITARGAWESVKRHFREMGIDCQSEDFTVVGIGDMSGDVFGNGMLLSRHIRLKAAFNHLHIFLDPDPDPEKSFAERERLFKLPRSQWTDYDEKLISKGGGIFSRRDKTVPISAEVKSWLGIKADTLTPQELIRELLTAPVDLLWNGGIGTYVKSSTESNSDVGDRANDAVRVNGADLRCKMVGEGGNLGLTQRGRIEYALNGGRINTDFIDNSAGVDCSDHEVNIKILLNRAMSEGQLGLEERNKLLAEMTEEVGDLVLRNNYLQTQAISMMEALTIERLGSKAHFIDVLESQGVIDRELEFLPNREEIEDRRKRGIGLTRPELAVMLSYSKITLYDELLASDVPEDPYLSNELVRYFPRPLRESFVNEMESHRLRREIIATVVTNSVVNRMGATFSLRMQEDTGARPAEVAKAYSVAREIFDVRDWWEAVEAHDTRVPSQSQVSVQLMIWNLLRHVTRWILNNHRGHLDIADLVQRYRHGADELVGRVAELAVAGASRKIHSRRQELESVGFDSDLAAELAGIPALNATLDIIEVAHRAEEPVARVAGIYFQLDRALKLSWLMNQIEELPVGGQWHAHARGGLRDELYRHHRALSAEVVAGADADSEPGIVVARWMQEHQASLAYFEHMMRDMRDSGQMDYATVSVAVRALEHMLSAMD